MLKFMLGKENSIGSFLAVNNLERFIEKWRGS